MHQPMQIQIWLNPIVEESSEHKVLLPAKELLAFLASQRGRISFFKDVASGTSPGLLWIAKHPRVFRQYRLDLMGAYVVLEETTQVRNFGG